MWRDENTPGVMNKDSKETLVAILKYLQSKWMKLFLKVDTSIGRLQCLWWCPAHKYNIYEDGVRIYDGTVLNNRPWVEDNNAVPISFSSPKISNLERYRNLVATQLSAYPNTIEAVSVTNDATQELQYSFDHRENHGPNDLRITSEMTDFHPAEIQNWKNWHQARYWSDPWYPPQYYGDSEIGKRWYKYKTERLIEFAKRRWAIFKNKWFKTVRDVWSFHDGITARTVRGIPAWQARPEIDALKDNPAVGYDIIFDAAVLKSYNSDYNWMEHTYVPDMGVEQNTNQLYEGTIHGKKNGVHITNISFADSYHDKNSPNYKATHAMMQRIAAEWWLNKKQVCTNSCAGLNISLNRIMGTGWPSWIYVPQYNELRAQCGIWYPAVTVNNDIP